MRPSRATAPRARAVAHGGLGHLLGLGISPVGVQPVPQVETGGRLGHRLAEGGESVDGVAQVGFDVDVGVAVGRWRGGRERGRARPTSTAAGVQAATHRASRSSRCRDVVSRRSPAPRRCRSATAAAACRTASPSSRCLARAVRHIASPTRRTRRRRAGGRLRCTRRSRRLEGHRLRPSLRRGALAPGRRPPARRRARRASAVVRWHSSRRCRRRDRGQLGRPRRLDPTRHSSAMPALGYRRRGRSSHFARAGGRSPSPRPALRPPARRHRSGPGRSSRGPRRADRDHRANGPDQRRQTAAPGR